jgi:signal peptidase II
VHQLPALQRTTKEQTVTSPATSSPGVRPALPWLVAAVTLIADQATKAWVTSSFLPGDSVPLIPSILHLTYVQNTGAAFGFFKGQQAAFIVVAALIIVWVGRELLRGSFTTRLTAWAGALILGGAAGNVIDRVRFGYVIDFIDLRVWPVFNIGDSAITIGVGLLLLHAMKGRGTPD